MSIRNLLGNHFCENYKFSFPQKYEIKWVDAKNLLSFNRIDIMAKYKYVEFLDKGYDMSFVTELYFEHIKAFSSGSFIEPGQENIKCSFAKYMEVFDSLITSIKSGFDSEVSLIPLDKNNTIIDGSHRVAIAAYYKLQLPVVKFPEMEIKYDYIFFKAKGLDLFYLDYLTSEYCKLKENICALCIWPIAYDPVRLTKIKTLLDATQKIVYKKTINLSFSALQYLFVEIYSGAQWLGSLDEGFPGALNYASRCFNPKGRVIVYFLEDQTPEDILSLKESIRNIWGIGNASVHTTDNKLETMKVAELLLNENSIHLLKYGRLYKYVDFFQALNEFKNELKNNNCDLGDFIVDSSSVLGLYGLRRVHDIDYLSIHGEKCEGVFEKADNHIAYAGLYETTLTSLIMNPRNFLYCYGLKFVSLERLKIFKRKRGEKKDLHDVRLIDTLLSQADFLEILYLKLLVYFRQKKSLIFYKFVVFVKKHQRLFKYPLKLYRYLRYGKVDV